MAEDRNGDKPLAADSPPRNVRQRDARVVGTERALTEALVALASEKPYHAVTTQELVRRAGVGRSTFYEHASSKDDFLVQSFERMLEAMDRALDQPGSAARIAPVAELFEHVGSAHEFRRTLERAQMLERLWPVGIRCLGNTIATRLAARGKRCAATGQALAGAVFGLLRWWLAQEVPPSPQAMDHLFHSILREGWPA